MSDESAVREELQQLKEAQAAKGLDKVRKFMKLMGPAWLAIALNIGGATVAAATVLGSATGYKFLWAIIPQVFAIWIICILFVWVTLVTGEGPVSCARKYLGEVAAWITGISVFIVNLVFHAVQYMLVGIIMETIFGVNQALGGLLGLAFVLVIVLNRGQGKRYLQIIENTLKALIWALLVAFILVLFLVEIDWGGFVRGLFVPSWPDDPQEMGRFLGVLGAAIAINVPVLAAYGNMTRGRNREYAGMSIFELTWTNVMLILVQFVILTAMAATLYRVGEVAEAPVAAALALEPLVGEFSTILYSLGLLGAVLTTMVSQVLISGYIVTDTLKLNRNVKSKEFKGSMLVVTIIGVTAPLFGWPAFEAVVYGSAFNLTFAPLLVIFWIIMANKEKVLGQYTVRPRLTIGVLIGLAITIIATGNFWVGVVGG